VKYKYYLDADRKLVELHANQDAWARKAILRDYDWTNQTTPTWERRRLAGVFRGEAFPSTRRRDGSAPRMATASLPSTPERFGTPNHF
jgi:hypothetical protein